MKSIGVFILVIAVSFASAEVVQKIQIQSTTGSTADFTYNDGSLTWSGGGYSFFVTDMGGYYDFDSAQLDFNYSKYSDSSAGGVAHGQFTLDSDWTISLFKSGYAGGNSVFSVSGNMDLSGNNPFGGRYYEDEVGTDFLDGRAWLFVDESTITYDATWASDFGLTGGISWDNDDIAGLDADVTLNNGTNFGDYDTDNYLATDGLSILLWADQDTVVPEPATMALLGLGALLLRRRRA